MTIKTVLPGLALILVSAMPGQVTSNTQTATIDELNRLIPRLQQALAASDMEQAATIVASLQDNINKVRAEQHSPSARLSRMEQRVASSPNSRASLLPYLAQAAFEAGDTGKAEVYATESLSRSTVHNSSEGAQIFYGNHVLGLLAISKGDVFSAKQYLLASGRTPGSEPLNRFGPNMALAKTLLDRGEQDAVLEFLGLAGSFWKSGANTLAQWQGAIRVGAKPDFGANLVIAP